MKRKGGKKQYNEAEDKTKYKTRTAEHHVFGDRFKSANTETYHFNEPTSTDFKVSNDMTPKGSFFTDFLYDVVKSAGDGLSEALYPTPEKTKAQKVEEIFKKSSSKDKSMEYEKDL